MNNPALKFLPLEKLSTNPARPRQTISQKSLTQLADSIREFGVLSPVLVNQAGGSYQIICGERRYRAAKIAGLEELPCLIINADANRLALYSLAENLQREPLNLVDQAFLVSKLHHNLGFTLIEIGESIGLTQEEIEKLMLIIDVPEKFRRAYLEGKLADKELHQLVKLDDPVQQEALFKELTEN